MSDYEAAIGRIVAYRAGPGRARGIDGDEVSPAIMTAVNEDGTVELSVFPKGSHQVVPVSNVSRSGDSEFQRDTWMPPAIASGAPLAADPAPVAPEPVADDDPEPAEELARAQPAQEGPADSTHPEVETVTSEDVGEVSAEELVGDEPATESTPAES